jgi:hypothetical protein
MSFGPIATEKVNALVTKNRLTVLVDIPSKQRVITGGTDNRTIGVLCGFVSVIVHIFLAH